MFQNITLIGNLGKDPEMRYTPTGQAVTDGCLRNRTLPRDQPAVQRRFRATRQGNHLVPRVRLRQNGRKL